MAMSSVWQLLISGKVTAWSTRIKLFDAIVSSTFLYASGIWGLRHKDVADKLQANFFKMLLGLTKCTPEYMIRVETGSTPLSTRILQRTLNYWIKLLNMSDNRYPKKCYNLLKDLDAKNMKTDKYNWYSNLKVALNSLGASSLIRDIESSRSKAAIPQILTKYSKSITEKDNYRVQNSRYNPMYKLIKNTDESRCEPYLQLPLPIAQIKALAQSRMSGLHTLLFKMKNISYKILELEPCLVCNLNQQETLEHILKLCPQYEVCRNKFITENNILNILKADNAQDIQSVFYFIKTCLTTRSFILSE